MSENKNIKISDLVLNTGQIEGLPKNPRFIRNERFESLKKSIQDAPEMLDYRRLAVYPFNGKYVVLCGNMRFRACKELGYKEMPCYVLPTETPAKVLREWVVKDNVAFGEIDTELLTEWDATELQEWGMELPEWNTENVEDFGDKNQEIDVDDFGDKVEIKFAFETEEWQFVNSELQKIDANKEQALLKLLNYNPNE